MKITEITNVVRHPAMKRKEAFDNLLMTGSEDDLISFIMDDNNSEFRRLALLKRLDLMLGHAQDVYDASDLEEFMNDQGPTSDSGWRDQLRSQIEKASQEYKDSPWANTGVTLGDIDLSKGDNISDEEMMQIAKDLKIPPYHLSVVDETQDEDIPTGEYEICTTCGGDGCPKCEQGLKDITGIHKVPNFDDYEGE